MNKFEIYCFDLENYLNKNTMVPTQYFDWLRQQEEKERK